MPTDKSDLLQGTLDMLILKIVALGPVHGYGISLRIRQISKEVLQVQQGSLYPALHRLEKRGWLTAEWGESDNGRQAKFYKLSVKGRKQLQAEESNWERLAQAVKQIMQTAQ
jgi:PadR family transcriptional regulator PadR